MTAMVRSCAALALVLVAACSDDTPLDVLARLNALPGITATEWTPPQGFAPEPGYRYFDLAITAPIDHAGSAGTVTLRAALMHKDVDAPLVIYAGGYDLDNAARYLTEPATLIGANQIALEYDRDVRHSGTTKYSLGKMLRFAVDGITSFSDVPLRFASYLGFIVSALAFIYAIVIVIDKSFRLHIAGYTPGWASTIVAVTFLGGVQLMSLGILGEYLGRVYDEVKGRPLYLISDIERS